MRRRAFLLAPAAAWALPAQAAEAGVSIDNFTFTPASLTVAAGTKVMWTNHDDIPHNVVSAERPPVFKSKVLDTDDSFVMVFATPGHYAYFCGLHPHMQGTIVVT